MTDDVPENSIRTDVLVIGAGQAGLAAAHFLTLEDIPHIVLDALPVVGDSWRRRYDALRLFTSRSLSSLPGMPLQGDPDGYAGRDEFADYLARYGRGRRVETGTEVTVLRRRGDLFEAAADDGRTFTSRAVVVATGAFTRPAVPALSAGFAPGVQQMHVSQFRNVGSVVDGTVLIVVDGASGRDAAMALAATHDVVLARGRPRRLFPERILGRSTWWWLHRLGLLRARPDSLIGRRMRRIDPFPLRGNGDADLARLGISLKPRLMAADGPAAVHGDGSRSFPAAIVWATGYADGLRRRLPLDRDPRRGVARWSCHPCRRCLPGRRPLPPGQAVAAQPCVRAHSRRWRRRPVDSRQARPTPAHRKRLQDMMGDCSQIAALGIRP